MRILLVEDDSLLGDGLRAGLRQLGFQVDWVRDGDAAERELRAQPYACAVLDLGLPRKDGLEVLAAIRRAGVSTPVLVLTARDAVHERIRGLDAGADDYVLKPVDLDELAARLRALVRRAHGQPLETLSAQDVVLEPASRSVRRAGEPVVLSTREFDLLQTFMLSANRVLSREQLEQRLYSWGQEVDSNAVEVHVHNLRRKLGAALIHTVRGVGYMLQREHAGRMKLKLRVSRSLQGRLLVLVLSVVVSVWLLTALASWIDTRHELDELLDGHLAQAAALLVVQQAQEMESDDHVMDAPTLDRYAPRVAFQVFHEGRLMMRSANAPVTPMVKSSKPFDTGFHTVQIGGTDWRVFGAHGAERDVHVYVGEQADSRSDILWAVLRSALWPMALALPLLGVALWWAVYRGLGPLRQAGVALAERQPQALHPLVLDGAPSEMAPMVSALNSLFERIATLLESERRFTADAAHELRTPIAAIRAQAQVAMGEADEALRRHALQCTLEGCDRATRLVEQLLTLARLEGVAASASRMDPVDLRALTQQGVAQVAPKAIAKHQTLEFEAPEPCPIPGNETLLAVLVRNLVDNAVRYSPPGARVLVSVRQQAGQVILRVQDSGPGLGDADLERLGERFFRVPGSLESGSGLGWSIVRRIAAVHGLQVQASRSATLGGLAVDVVAPEASAA